MMRFSFRKGLRFHRGNRVWILERRLMDGSLRLEAEDGEIVNATEAEILAGSSQGTWHIYPTDQSEGVLIESRVQRDLSSFSVVAQAGAIRRQNYLNRLLEDGKLVSTPETLRRRIREVAQEIKDDMPPSPTSVYRWYRRYCRARSIVALADRHEARGRKVAWSSEVRTVVDESIDTIYLNPQKHPGRAVYEEIQRRLLALQRQNPDKLDQLRIPSRPTIYRYLAKLEKYAVDAARLGKPAANRKFRTVLGQQRAERILERWEIDHTPLDLIVFDEESKMPHGRPWLTIALDKHSRMVVGFYIGFGNPSAYSVLQCLRQAILPKQQVLEPYDDITMSWPVRGIPEVLVCDNGMELHSGSLNRACQELNIQIQYCPAKLPEYKGSVERFFRTVSQGLIHRLPGTTFSNIWKRGDYASEKLACIGFKTLHALLCKWIVEVYHQEVHRGIGMSPARKWEMAERERIIEHPADPGQLKIITAHTAERTLFHYGVEINGLRYNSHELHTLYRRYGKKQRLLLKFHEDDISYIHVFDPDEKAYVRVSAIDQEYSTGLTLDQHELIRQKLREEARDHTDWNTILAKKKELQDMIDAAVAHKKMGMRKKAAKLRHIDSVYQNGLDPKTTAANERHTPPPALLAAATDELPVFAFSENKLYEQQECSEPTRVKEA